MPSPDPVSAEAILAVLAGALDECSRALARGDVPKAQDKLHEAMEQLQRVRRDLRG